MFLGSVKEVKYCLLLGFDLGYLTREQYEIANRKDKDVKAVLIQIDEVYKK